MEEVEESLQGIVTKDVWTNIILHYREKHGENYWERLQEEYEWHLEERLYHAWGDTWQERLQGILNHSEQIREEAYTLQLGNKRFECANHLGNVLAVVSDKKVQSDGAVWSAVVVSVQDYYPFGMSMPGRSSSSYRYGFNGKETDPETGIQDYGMRWYLPNIARFPSVDPITAKYPMLTPYQFASNTPIMALDLDGLEAFFFGSKEQLKAIQQQSVLREPVPARPNIDYTAYELTTLSNATQVLKTFNEEYGLGKKVVKAVYIQTHGSSNLMAAGEGADGKLSTEAVAPNTYAPPSDDINVNATNINDYLGKGVMGEKWAGVQEFIPSSAAVHKLKTLMDQIADNGTLILAGCHLGHTGSGSTDEGAAFLQAAFELSGGRINIVVNNNFTPDVPHCFNDEVIGTPRTLPEKIAQEECQGWRMIGPQTNKKVVNKGVLVLDGMTERKENTSYYHFQPCEGN